MNSNIDGDGIRDEQSAAALLQRIKFSGLVSLLEFLPHAIDSKTFASLTRHLSEQPWIRRFFNL